MSGKRGVISDKRKSTGAAAVAAGLALLTLLAVPLLQSEHLAQKHPNQSSTQHVEASHSQPQSAPFRVILPASAMAAGGHRHNAHPCPLCQFYLAFSKVCSLLLAFLAALAAKMILLGEWVAPVRRYPVHLRNWRSRAPPAAILYGALFFGPRAAARRSWG